MKNKVKQIIAILVVITITILAFWGGTHNTPWRSVTVTNVGPNYETDKYIYRVVKGERFPGDMMVRTDVETAEDTELFRVEKEESDSIHEVVECEGGVLFTLSQPYADVKYSLNYLSFDSDLKNIDMQTLYTSEYELILKDKDGEITLIENDDQKYVIDPLTREMAPEEIQESDKKEQHPIYEDVPEQSVTLNNGTEIVLKKKFGEENYTGVVGGNTYTIDSISGPDYIYAQWGYFSDIDGKLYGVITIPKKRLNKNRMKVGGSRLLSDYVEKEILFSLDVSTGENSIVYQADKGRIIGFIDDTVYLIHKNGIYKIDIASGQKENLAKIHARKNTNLDFRWIGAKLFIFETLTQKTVAVIEG